MDGCDLCHRDSRAKGRFWGGTSESAESQVATEPRHCYRASLYLGTWQLLSQGAMAWQKTIPNCIRLNKCDLPCLVACLYFHVSGISTSKSKRFCKGIVGVSSSGPAVHIVDR